MSDWIEWHGGECPVPHLTLVDVKRRDGGKTFRLPAWQSNAEGYPQPSGAGPAFWRHDNVGADIVAYRIHNAEIVKSDPVNFPSHYRQGEIECIDAIKSALTPEEFRGYCKGNALKYAWREKHKGGDESLKKAVWYLNKAAE